MPQSTPQRRTLWDVLEAAAPRNAYCSLSDLSNEASVEAFFVSRLLPDMGYRDAQIKTKESIDALVVSRGRSGEKYKPDYVLVVDGLPRCVVDAKGVEEELEKWVGQCSGYCLVLNRKFEKSNPVRYFVLTNGLSTQVYEWDKEQPVLALEFGDFDVGCPKYAQLRAIVGADRISEPAAAQDAKQQASFLFTRPASERARHLFAACHRVIWKSEVCSPSRAFTEFTKLMFVKLWADRELRSNSMTRDAFEDGADTVALPSSAVRFCASWIESREAEGAVNPVDSILFERLRDEIERDVQLRKKKRIFDKGERIRLRPDTVKDVVRRVEHVDMFGIDEDLNGRLFETFLSATMRGRELGQFFTPRSIVKMMVQLADLKADGEAQETVIDACCGSGGFLIEALSVMRNQIRGNASLSPERREELQHKISNECLYGIDYGKDPPLARIARINMYLHGDGGSRIYFADALDKALDTGREDDPEVIQNLEELRGALREPGTFDVALTNPPFSMTKELKNETHSRILRRYEIARKSDTSAALRPSLRSSVMFLERYHDLLKPGGRLITVIDDTLLASGMFKFVRDFIRSRFLIKATVSLPGDAFRRSGSRVKTSVLVLEKKRRPGEAQPDSFAFFSEWLGVDDLTPRASEAEIRAARARAEAEVARIVTGYKAYLRGERGPMVISSTRLADRLDLKYCVPQFGRMAKDWAARGVEVKKLSQCVRLVQDPVVPSECPEEEFTLIRVSYDGRCEVDKVAKGKTIKAKLMYRVREGQMVFSTIRATDGAIGIVPDELDGGLVSGSYSVFSCGSAQDTAYLWAVLRSYEIRADMQSLSPGSGRYTTYWPHVGDVQVPWLSKKERRAIGRGLIKAWRRERQAELELKQALGQIDDLGVESAESIRRWRASKAPT